jgi:hypothetical protein
MMSVAQRTAIKNGHKARRERLRRYDEAVVRLVRAARALVNSAAPDESTLRVRLLGDLCDALNSPLLPTEEKST